MTCDTTSQPCCCAKNEEIERLKKAVTQLEKIIHDMTVVQQAAWIEWQHGEGAEEAMVWIENGLAGPGLIPDEDEPYGKEAQAWYDANRSDPFPACYCGRPSNNLWMGEGFCCKEHYEARRANLAKIETDGHIAKDENGKVMKPEGWTPPDLSPFVCKKGNSE